MGSILEMTQEQAIHLLLKEPIRIGQLMGFNLLKDIHNEWIKSMFYTEQDETLQAHRGSYKTTCITIAIPILMMLKPNLKILFMKKTDTDVKEVVRQIVKILKTDEMRYFAKVIWNKDIEFTTETQNELNLNLNTAVSGTNQLVAMGIGGSITGKHFDYIFTDDIVNIDDRTSKAERDKTKLIYNELQNIKNRGGRIFNTGTPWHKDDCFSLMPNLKKFDCYTTGLITKEQIQDIKSKLSPSLFAANYELRHIASEDVIFENPNLGAEEYKVEQGIGHIDAAYEGEDYTAFTMVKQSAGKFYVFGKLWRKHVIDMENEILRLAKNRNCGKIYNEQNADKGFLRRDLEEKGARVELYHESQNKYIKIVTFLKAVWQNVIFTKDTDKEYIQQILDYNENAEHDDAPDSLSSLIRVLDKRQKNFSFE